MRTQDAEVIETAEDRRRAIKAVRDRRITATVGAPLRPYKSRWYYTGQCAHAFAAVALAGSWAAGAPILVCLPVAGAAGLASGFLFHRAPQLWDRLMDRLER